MRLLNQSFALRSAEVRLRVIECVPQYLQGVSGKTRLGVRVCSHWHQIFPVNAATSRLEAAVMAVSFSTSLMALALADGPNCRSRCCASLRYRLRSQTLKIRQARRRNPRARISPKICQPSVWGSQSIGPGATISWSSPRRRGLPNKAGSEGSVSSSMGSTIHGRAAGAAGVPPNWRSSWLVISDSVVSDISGIPWRLSVSVSRSLCASNLALKRASAAFFSLST